MPAATAQQVKPVSINENTQTPFAQKSSQKQDDQRKKPPPAEVKKKSGESQFGLQDKAWANFSIELNPLNLENVDQSDGEKPSTTSASQSSTLKSALSSKGSSATIKQYSASVDQSSGSRDSSRGASSPKNSSRKSTDRSSHDELHTVMSSAHSTLPVPLMSPERSPERSPTSRNTTPERRSSVSLIHPDVLLETANSPEFAHSPIQPRMDSHVRVHSSKPPSPLDDLRLDSPPTSASPPKEFVHHGHARHFHHSVHHPPVTKEPISRQGSERSLQKSRSPSISPIHLNESSDVPIALIEPEETSQRVPTPEEQTLAEEEIQRKSASPNVSVERQSSSLSTKRQSPSHFIERQSPTPVEEHRSPVVLTPSPLLPDNDEESFYITASQHRSRLSLRVQRPAVAQKETFDAQSQTDLGTLSIRSRSCDCLSNSTLKSFRHRLTKS